jgi:hypothetical protein
MVEKAKSGKPTKNIIGINLIAVTSQKNTKGKNSLFIRLIKKPEILLTEFFLKNIVLLERATICGACPSFINFEQFLFCKPI